jgi:hypothetical protein
MLAFLEKDHPAQNLMDDDIREIKQYYRDKIRELEDE